MQFGHKIPRIDCVAARVLAETFEKNGEVIVPGGFFAHLKFLFGALVGEKPLRVGHPEEKAAEPVSEVAADQKQIAATQLGEHSLRSVAGLQGIREFQSVFVMNGVEGRNVRLAEE